MQNSMNTRRFLVDVAASQTDQVILAAQLLPSGQNASIRVLGVTLSSGVTAATTVQFNSKGGGAGTRISPLYRLGGAAAQPAQITLPIESLGWFETNQGEALTISNGPDLVTLTVLVAIV